MPSSSRRRLDVVLVERSFAPSLERAQSLIAAGMVEVDGRRSSGAGQLLAGGAAIRMLGRHGAGREFVSRAGGKLAGALEAFSVGCEGRVALDAGASTGGFTDVLLRSGARHVYAVDVGYGQLDSRLTGDARVTVMDRTNLRLLEGVPGEPPDLVTLDLSFISLRRVLGPVAALMGPGGGDVVALFKPQFELPRHAVGRGGLVLDEGAAADAARTLLTWASDTIGARGSGPVAARVRGATGNQEFFVHLRLPPRGRDVEAAPS